MKAINLKLGAITIMIIAILSICLFSGCKDTEEDLLIGEWVSITEDYNYGDTIVFTSDGKIQKWKDLTYNPYDSTNNNVRYEVSNDSISITKNGYSRSFQYSINNSNLTINSLGFAFTLLALAPKDIKFKSIK